MAEKDFTVKDRAAFSAFVTWLGHQPELKGAQRRIMGMLGAAEILHKRGDVEIGTYDASTFGKLRGKIVDAMDDDEDLRGHQPTPSLLIPPAPAKKPAVEKPAESATGRTGKKQSGSHAEAVGVKKKKGDKKSIPTATHERHMDIMSDFETWLRNIVGGPTLTTEELSQATVEPYDTIIHNYVDALLGVIDSPDSPTHAGALEKARTALIKEISPRIKIAIVQTAFKEELPDFERDIKAGKKIESSQDIGDDIDLRGLFGR
jgi:hypothetical protein